MGIKSIHKQKDGQQEATIKFGYKNTYTNSWKVIVDSEEGVDVSSSEQAVMLAAAASGTQPSPSIGASHPDNASSICQATKCTRDRQNAEVFYIVATYAPLPEGKNSDDHIQNPLARPVKFSKGVRVELVPLEKNKDGEPIRNSAGDEFIDPIMVEKHFPILYAKKNVAQLSTLFQFDRDFNNTVNDDDFQGWSARKVRYLPVESGEEIEENGITYYRATFSWEVDEEEWKVRVVDQGYYEKDAQGNRTRINDSDGKPKETVSLLDGNGQALGANEVGVIVEDEKYMEADYGDILTLEA